MLCAWIYLQRVTCEDGGVAAGMYCFASHENAGTELELL
jgi:hypothetical protein